MKMSKFLICENPMTAGQDGRLFILHTGDPSILAEVHHFEDITDEQRMNIERQMSIGSRLDYVPETIFFSPIWICKAEQISNLQDQADNLAGIMRRMADWYKAYLIWEDAQ